MENDKGELKCLIISDKEQRKVLIQFGESIRWFGMDAAQARGLAVLLCEKANELDQPTGDAALDWENALTHFKTVRKQYQELVGVPGVNPVLALTNVFQPIAERFYKGERTAELHRLMMSVE